MTETPAINESLIRQYADQHASGDAAGLRNLITIFDFQRRQMQRAEDLCRTAWGEVERLSKLGRPAPSAIGSAPPTPNTNTQRPQQQRSPASTQPQHQPSSTTTKRAAVPQPAEIDMDDL